MPDPLGGIPYLANESSTCEGVSWPSPRTFLSVLPPSRVDIRGRIQPLTSFQVSFTTNANEKRGKSKILCGQCQSGLSTWQGNRIIKEDGTIRRGPRTLVYWDALRRANRMVITNLRLRFSFKLSNRFRWSSAVESPASCFHQVPALPWMNLPETNPGIKTRAVY